MTNTENELKPCPCCRSKVTLRTSRPSYHSDRDHNKASYKIVCNRCPIKTGTLVSKEKLIVAWDTRAEPQEVDVDWTALAERLSYKCEKPDWNCDWVIQEVKDHLKEKGVL